MKGLYMAIGTTRKQRLRLPRLHNRRREQHERLAATILAGLLASCDTVKQDKLPVAAWRMAGELMELGDSYYVETT